MAVIRYEDFPTPKVVDMSDKAADFNYNSGYKAGYADAIHKACKWLNAHADDYIYEQYDIIRMEDNFVTDFCKAMEG